VCRQAIESACDREASPGEPVASTLHIQNCPDGGSWSNLPCPLSSQSQAGQTVLASTTNFPDSRAGFARDFRLVAVDRENRLPISPRRSRKGLGEKGEFSAAFAMARDAAKCIDTGNLGGSHEEKAR
jgi:hypothetical protein